MAERTKKALLILDMLNLFDFPEAGLLLPKANKIVGPIRKLKDRFHKRGMPVIYVNDNFGKWKSDANKVYEICSGADSRGRKIALDLQPEEKDFFVLKPKYSGFYSTTLQVLLEQLKIKSLVITGIAGNICVLFTANDAHMRDYQVIVPQDCIASNTDKDNRNALHQFEHVFGFKTPTSGHLKL